MPYSVFVSDAAVTFVADFLRCKLRHVVSNSLLSIYVRLLSYSGSIIYPSRAYETPGAHSIADLSIIQTCTMPPKVDRLSGGDSQN